jgi:hypothetical protein
MSLITTKFSRVSPVYLVHSFDVGYVLEINGFNTAEVPEWVTLKMTAMTVEDLKDLISEVDQMPRAV